MNERDLEARLRDTFRREASEADPGALFERVHAIPTMAGRHRSHWWQRLGFGAARSVGSGGIHVRGANSMIAATGITAAIAALTIGGAFLAAQVDSPPPGGQQPAAAESWVTVTGQQDGGCRSDGTCYATNHDMSDPRLDGDVSITFNYETGAGSAEGNYVLWGDLVLTNEGGSWEGNWVGFTDENGRHHITSWFEGTGDYEGLQYLEQAYEPEAGMSLATTGLLFEGDIPATVLPPVVAAAADDPQ